MRGKRNLPPKANPLGCHDLMPVAHRRRRE